jgi:hypothetical protein
MQIIAAGIVIESWAKTNSETCCPNTVQQQNSSIKNVFPISDSIIHPKEVKPESDKIMSSELI